MKPFPTTRSPRRRAALTLTEVLIAMGVLAVGLLGVAAVFPVGGLYMQTGDVADRAAAIAQAALDDAVVRGHLDPENWIVHDVGSLILKDPSVGFAFAGGTAENGKRFMRFLSGETNQDDVIRRLGLRDAVGLDYAGPLAAGFGEIDVMGTSTRVPTVYRSTLFGGAFVIDPIGIANALDDQISEVGRRGDLVYDLNLRLSAAARRYPSFVNDETFWSRQWDPWILPRVGSSSNVASRLWPVRRVTTVHNLNQINNSPGGFPAFSYASIGAAARGAFSSADDLAQAFPDAGDEPVRQRWDTWNTAGASPQASSRQALGNYSWLISVCPSSSAAVDALASSPGAYAYEVSAVVFHKRAQARGPSIAVENERLVQARVLSNSPGGGELVLSRRPAGGSLEYQEPETSPFEDLRGGQYVMVVGPHPQSTPQHPQLAVRWCRVLGVEERGQVTFVDGRSEALDKEQQVVVSLRGPDWPWRVANDSTDRTLLSNDLRVAIVPGAVAVHTKTMRLDAGTAWAVD